MADLQPPGRGLPNWERACLSSVLKLGAFISSDSTILKRFQLETRRIQQLYDDDESYDVFQTLLIPRVIGIEDSSRNWSIAMVLEHLHLVNKDLTTAIDALGRGIVPHGEIDVAIYKPDEDLGTDVMQRMRDTNENYCQVIETIMKRHGRLPHTPHFDHPWFGPLNAHQWHALAAAHQTIHRRQIQKIIAMLGVT